MNVVERLFSFTSFEKTGSSEVKGSPVSSDENTSNSGKLSPVAVEKPRYGAEIYFDDLVQVELSSGFFVSFWILLESQTGQVTCIKIRLFLLHFSNVFFINYLLHAWNLQVF